MNIRDLVSQDLITLDLKAKDKNSAIAELADILDRAGRLDSLSEYVKSVHEREALTTTAVGFGVAIPHARSSAVKQTAVAFGRSVGFHWETNREPNSDELVRLVFLLAVPEKNPNTEYMRILASIARMLVHEDFRESLLNATNPQDVLDAINARVEGVSS